MDTTDRKILAILQEDASLSIADIGARVNLSQTPCWRRIQRLEQGGVIERRVALLNPDAIGIDITVFVAIQTSDHSSDWLARFRDVLLGMPAVMEVYRMAGDIDYLLRVAVPSMAAYDEFYRQLIEQVPLKDVSSRFAMERVKFTTSYPLPS